MKKFLNAIKLLVTRRTDRKNFFYNIGEKITSLVKKQIQNYQERKQKEKEEEKRVKKEKLTTKIYNYYTEIALLAIDYVKLTHPSKDENFNNNEEPPSETMLEEKFKDIISSMLSTINTLSLLLSSESSQCALKAIQDHIDKKNLSDFKSFKEIENYTLEGYSISKKFDSTQKSE